MKHELDSRIISITASELPYIRTSGGTYVPTPEVSPSTGFSGFILVPFVNENGTTYMNQYSHSELGLLLEGRFWLVHLVRLAEARETEYKQNFEIRQKPLPTVFTDGGEWPTIHELT